MIYAYASLMEGVPFANGAPNLTVDIPVMHELSRENEAPICGKDFKTGQTLMKTILAPGFKARMLGVSGWYLHQHSRQSRWRSARRSGVVQNEGRIQAVACSSTSCSPNFIPISTAISTTRFALTITRHVVITKRVGTTSTSSAGSATPCRSRWTSSAATPSLPRPSCSTWSCSSTSPSARQELRGIGIQEWLSFYFKSPMTAPGLYPEHDLFIQVMKLKNTLRHLTRRGTDHAPRPGVLRLRRWPTNRVVRAECGARARLPTFCEPTNS